MDNKMIKMVAMCFFSRNALKATARNIIGLIIRENEPMRGKYIISTKKSSL